MIRFEIKNEHLEDFSDNDCVCFTQSSPHIWRSISHLRFLGHGHSLGLGRIGDTVGALAVDSNLTDAEVVCFGESVLMGCFVGCVVTEETVMVVASVDGSSVPDTVVSFDVSAVDLDKLSGDASLGSVVELTGDVVAAAVVKPTDDV